MKNFLFALCTLLAIAFLSTGCPVGLDYSLSEPGTEKIDKKLVGTWTATNPEGEVQKVKVEKNDDKSYKIEVIETGEMYALEVKSFDGWVATLDGKKFLYVRPIDDDNKYYHYNYDFEDGKLVTHDISLLINGVDGLTSTESLRTEVSESLKKPDCLTNRIEYVKE